MANLSYLTKEGFEKLREKLNYLERIQRPAASLAIAEARDKGDLSENAEYDAAKEAQGLLEAKIAKLKDTLINSRIIDKSQIDTSKVQILNRVKIKNKKNNAMVTYTLVAESEADLKQGKLFVGSPIGKGLLGKKVGDIVNIKIPSGAISFEVLEISI